MLTLGSRLRALHPTVPGRRLKQWLEGSRVRVDGVVVRRGDTPVGPDARVELGPPAPPPFPRPLRLVHEDAEVLVVDKPAGLLTVATDTERHRTAYRLLRDWTAARERGGRIFVVHRLDRETSGLLVFARTAAAKRRLQAQFEARTAERVYVALVQGRLREAEGTLSGRLVEDRTLRVRATRAGGRGREAITRWRVLERLRDATVLELALVTGRRGQLRAQLAAAGHPILGDRAHGAGPGPLGRLCLHATRLGFVHPEGRRMVFESLPPPGFRAGSARRPGRVPAPGRRPPGSAGAPP